MSTNQTMHIKAERYFSGDLVLNIELSESLRHGDGVLVEAGDYGVLVRHGNEAVFMVSATDREYGAYLLTLISEKPLIMQICQEWLADLAIDTFGLKGKLPCYKLAYLKRQPIEYDATLHIRPSDPLEAGLIAAHYDIHDEEEIRALIADGKLWSGYLDHDMVGFIGRHPEGSMGMLHVFEQYRLRRFGYELEAFLLNHLLANCEIPRGDVIVGNDKSLKLQEKLGFTKANTPVFWVY